MVYDVYNGVSWGLMTFNGGNNYHMGFINVYDAQITI